VELYWPGARDALDARARRGSAFWGYVGGLGATIAVMNVFQAAQPALLYIVPAVLLAVGVHAQLRGEFRKARALLALLQGLFHAAAVLGGAARFIPLR
jgi:hypothetical protein